MKNYKTFVVEGWIDQSVVITKLTADRYNAPKFEEERTEGYEKPTVRRLRPILTLG